MLMYEVLLSVLVFGIALALATITTAATVLWVTVKWGHALEDHARELIRSAALVRCQCAEAIELGEALDTAGSKTFARSIAWAMLVMERDLESLLPTPIQRDPISKRRPMVGTIAERN